MNEVPILGGKPISADIVNSLGLNSLAISSTLFNHSLMRSLSPVSSSLVRLVYLDVSFWISVSSATKFVNSLTSFSPVS